MPGKNKYPLLGWHPPADLAAWARAEAARRGVPLAAVLTEALAAYRDQAEVGITPPWSARERWCGTSGPPAC